MKFIPKLPLQTFPIGLWSGKAPILVRAGTEPGRVTVQAEVNGMMSNVLELYTMAPKTDKLDGALPIRDLARIRVDIGGEGQLPQFDWVSWVANDEGASEKQFDTFGGFKAKIAPASAHGILRSLGEMNVKGKYGYAFGEGVAAIDDQGLVLELTGVPTGQYKFTSFHHAPQPNTNDMDPNREKLKSLKLPSWAYAKDLEVHFTDANRNIQVHQIRVTDGGTIEGPWPGMSKIMIYSDGHSPISIRFVAPDKKAIWFNAFEIQAWD
ncbi:hypothetical protein CLV98_10363 [Dyadobacter jejuensis]|uniref:Uncharacterized protein n=1 Tax=Dyadobacter jejuensis TaxID=1082580 RepID=A0A316AMM7_9BACT|nr:hypothetical protein [Dyadobacter jejuensis]PWJ58698.1 hypothetical protein CLV98_10363 [Dyadobacter jejuensis]